MAQSGLYTRLCHVFLVYITATIQNTSSFLSTKTQPKVDTEMYFQVSLSKSVVQTINKYIADYWTS